MNADRDTAVTPGRAHYLESFRRFEERASPGAPSWLSPLRKAAIARFAEIGFPTTRDEQWRCTSVAPIAKIPFRLAPASPCAPGAGRADNPRAASGKTALDTLADGGDLRAGRAAHEESLLVQGSGGLARRAPGDHGAGVLDRDPLLRSLFDGAVAGLERGFRLVFLNGRFVPELSSAQGLPRGVELASLRSVLAEGPGSHHGASGLARVQAHLARHAAVDQQAFTALNTAFMEDGAVLSLPERALVADPILLLFLSSNEGEPAVCHPRNLILAGPGSQATIVESYVGPDGAAYFTNAVTEIVAEDGALVEHYKVQREGDSAFHVATLQASLGPRSVLASHSISLGGALTRNDLNAVLDGEGAECSLDGLFVATGRQHVDNHTVIDHAKPHGTSREVYKGILGGSSRGVFDGKVIVRPDAQKTDAKQVNKNLLLSDGALIDTKPQLEIRADDVKCAHAATIGRLDEAALFYLRSRGVGLRPARGMLIGAFAGEITDRMKIASLRAQILDEVGRTLLADGWAGDGEAA